MSFADISRKSAVWLIALLCVFPLSATNPQKKEMKELNVKKVSLANVAVENIPALLDKEKVAFQSINTVNWKAFPYQPEVQFRIAHTDDAILVHYKVKEDSKIKNKSAYVILDVNKDGFKYILGIWIG